MLKILVVDDEPDVCDFVKNFFEARGLRVLIALNGKDALRIVKEKKPAIILLDVRMKKMDGIEVLREIREINKNVKVIMVTAVNEGANMEAARKLGCEKYITKPLVLEELEAAVKEYVKECEDGQ